MHTPPPTATTAQPPDPHQDPAPAASPTRTARLLGLVRKLIDFGTAIAAAVQQRPAGEDLMPLARRFGTKSIALMLTTIAQGLRLAAVLEERLGGPPAHLNPAHATARAITPPRARNSPRAPRPESPSQDNRRPTLPTSRKIAAWCRHYPVETILIHVRTYLGLTPDDPLWQEVNDLLIEHHADLMRKAQTAAATPSPQNENRGSGHASARASDTRTKNQYRAYLMRSTSCPLPDMPLMPSRLPRQPAPHLVSAATSGAGPPRKAA